VLHAVDYGALVEVVTKCLALSWWASCTEAFVSQNQKKTSCDRADSVCHRVRGVRFTSCIKSERIGTSQSIVNRVIQGGGSVDGALQPLAQTLLRFTPKSPMGLHCLRPRRKFNQNWSKILDQF
jgi:hypothetical protein